MKLTIELRSKPDKTQELHQALQALLPSIRREKGCRDCRVWQDVENGENGEVFFLDVEWETRESLEQAMRSGIGGAFLGAVDLLSERARVRFGEDSSWEGVDALKRMRKKT